MGRVLCALLLAALGPACGEPRCRARELAKYRLTFTGKWTQAAFPKQYPLFRPPAQWSSLLGECGQSPCSERGCARGVALRAGGQVRAGGRPLSSAASVRPGTVHSGDYSLWRAGQFVTNGLRDFAERGEAWALMREMEAAGEQLQSLHAVFAAPAVPSGTGQSTAELEAHPGHPLVSPGGRGAVRGVARAGPRLSGEEEPGDRAGSAGRRQRSGVRAARGRGVAGPSGGRPPGGAGGGRA